MSKLSELKGRLQGSVWNDEEYRCFRGTLGHMTCVDHYDDHEMNCNIVAYAAMALTSMIVMRVCAI